MKDINSMVRRNILDMEPYAAARHLINAHAVFLDANESPYETGYNRYPDPWQKQLKQRISEIKEVPINNIFIGNGSDEIIDLLLRIFCEPGINNIIITPPTYGMYEVSAAINNIAVLEAPLNDDYSLDEEMVLKTINENTRMVYLCSPNNPTGNALDIHKIEKILTLFNGVVVIDEAYIEFSSTPSWIDRLSEFNNLVVMQTLSKAHGLAGLRIGLGFAGEEILRWLNKVKPPYNVSGLNQKAAIKNLINIKSIRHQVEEIIEERERIEELFEIFSFVEKIHPSEANFILIKVKAPEELYNFLKVEGLIVRERNNVINCEGCLRITIGTPEENDLLINKLKQYEEK